MNWFERLWDRDACPGLEVQNAREEIKSLQSQVGSLQTSLARRAEDTIKLRAELETLKPRDVPGHFLICPNCQSLNCYVVKPIVRWWLPEGGIPEPRGAGATNQCLNCGQGWHAESSGASPVKPRESQDGARDRPAKPAARDADLKWRG